jgi:hypothetical protein
MKSVATTDFAVIVVSHPFLPALRRWRAGFPAPAFSKSKDNFPYSRKKLFFGCLTLSFDFQDLRING